MAPNSAADKKALIDLLNSTFALLSQFSLSLSSATDAPAQTPPPVENAPNPLHVLRDAGKLLKAHTTKVSLLAINKPFTPSAIITVVKEMSGTCLPAMMSAVQICCSQDKATWGSLMGGEVKTRVSRAFRELEALLKEIKSLAEGNSTNLRSDSLSSTGVVWEACDSLIALEAIGIAGLAVQKAEQYRDTIKDAITELQEWRDGEDTDNEGHEDELLDDFDEGVDGDNESLDDIFNAANSMPKGNPELKAQVDEAEGKLKKFVLLYNALMKRRLKTFKSGDKPQKNATDLDSLMSSLKRIPNLVDELIGSFYDLDDDNAKEMLRSCIAEARDAATIVQSNWEGKEDEFTEWHKKWIEAIA